MWKNYGITFIEYVYLKHFRKNNSYLGVKDEGNLLQIIKEKKLSVRATEDLVRKVKFSNKDIETKKYKNQYILDYEKSLLDFFKSKVIIKKTKNKGFINIQFSNESDLDRIVKTILNEK